MEKMTMREFLNGVIAEVEKEELKNFAKNEIKKMDEKNAKRKNTPTENQLANEKLLADIIVFLKDKDFMTSKEVADHFDITVNKSASLLRKLDNDGLTEIKEVKSPTGKGKVKAHKLIEKANKLVTEVTE